MNTTADNGPLTGALTFATVTGMLARASTLLPKNGGAVTLDLSGVTQADSAGLALLLELTRRAHSAGREFRFTGAPAQVVDLARFFGLDQILPLSA